MIALPLLLDSYHLMYPVAKLWRVLTPAEPHYHSTPCYLQAILRWIPPSSPLTNSTLLGLLLVLITRRFLRKSLYHLPISPSILQHIFMNLLLQHGSLSLGHFKPGLIPNKDRRHIIEKVLRGKQQSF
ncbi:hypothetical protein DSO57_1028602 [Entomophthora muscae]|uniref:Uncharacterized protein n=1 Tax=Entomophthora muscae TaxID=34485 RepID=A0ACC2SED0_9FUNG|nr:hypothetical protein DSO57_1028602 [Entomophthora muscae]